MSRVVTSFRVAIRAEGPFVNAYWAPLDSMDGAQLVGSIRRDICDRTPEAFQAFATTMQIVGHSLATATGGAVVEIGLREAPEHEKAGHA